MIDTLVLQGKEMNGVIVFSQHFKQLCSLESHFTFYQLCQFFILKYVGLKQSSQILVNISVEKSFGKHRPVSYHVTTISSA